MPDIAAVLNDAVYEKGWADLSGRLTGGAPQAMFAVVGLEMFSRLANDYARVALCDSGSGSDGCASCSAWSGGEHPDFMIVGDGASPPGIADCVGMQAWMSLKPFIARGRLAVIMFADSLSLPSANSLLKTAEEPPEGGRLLFLAEEDNLIPTIRSRTWSVRFTPRRETPNAPPPEGSLEWAAWLEKTRKQTLDELTPEIESWIGYLAGVGDWQRASSLRNAVYLSKKRRLPISMVQDVMLAVLKEGERIGQIFGDLR
jgi:DNA polymerase-3 subunit delta'